MHIQSRMNRFVVMVGIPVSWIPFLKLLLLDIFLQMQWGASLLMLVSSLSLWSKFIMDHSVNVVKNSGCAVHIWARLSWLFWAWAVSLRWLLPGFSVIPVNPHLIVCNYLQKEFWVSLKPVLKVLACADNDTTYACYSVTRAWIWW